MRIISGKFRNRQILTPKGLEVRPSADRLRESLFNICQNFIESSRFLDLYAGSGAIGIEALSRGAIPTFVDLQKESISCIKKNLDSLGVSFDYKVMQMDAMQALKFFERNGVDFDIIFIDPPYSKGNYEDLLCYIAESSVLKNSGHVFLETASEAHFNIPAFFILNSTRRIGRASLYHLSHSG
ncbi:MAG: 16S rRNA (guanine(966)-N(2))-methyltransferase RsmD [Chlamydiales bacterium]